MTVSDSIKWYDRAMVAEERIKQLEHQRDEADQSEKIVYEQLQQTRREVDELRAALAAIMDVRWTNDDDRMSERDLPTVRGEIRTIARDALGNKPLRIDDNLHHADGRIEYAPPDVKQ